MKAKQYRKIAKVKKEIDVLEVKQTIVQQTKGERVEIDRIVAQERMVSRKKALQQKQSVRKAQLEAGQKIETYRNARMQLVSRVQNNDFMLLSETSDNHPYAQKHHDANSTCTGFMVYVTLLGNDQARDEYERKLRDEMEARIAKEKELARLVMHFNLSRIDSTIASIKASCTALHV